MQDRYNKSDNDLLRFYGKHVLNNPEHKQRLPFQFYKNDILDIERKKAQEKEQKLRESIVLKAMDQSTRKIIEQQQAQKRRRMKEVGLTNLQRIKRSESLKLQSKEQQLQADKVLIQVNMERQRQEALKYQLWKQSLTEQMVRFRQGANLRKRLMSSQYGIEG